MDFEVFTDDGTITYSQDLAMIWIEPTRVSYETCHGNAECLLRHINVVCVVYSIKPCLFTLSSIHCSKVYHWYYELLPYTHNVCVLYLKPIMSLIGRRFSWSSGHDWPACCPRACQAWSTTWWYGTSFLWYCLPWDIIFLRAVHNIVKYINIECYTSTSNQVI